MPSIIIPTKSNLIAYKTNPSQLIKDKEAEDYFVNVDEYQFLRKLSDAIRAGQVSVTYNTTAANATAIKNFLTKPEYGYGYEDETNVKIIQNLQQPTFATLQFTWTYS